MTRKSLPIAKPRRHPRGFSVSLMSDTKWRKLFTALDRPDLEAAQVLIKFVDTERVHTVRLPRRANLHSPKAFIDMFEFGPLPLRSIEWIEFPAVAEYPNVSPDGKGRVPSTRVPQNIERIASILADLGQFPMELSRHALRINGHAR